MKMIEDLKEDINNPLKEMHKNICKQVEVFHEKIHKSHMSGMLSFSSSPQEGSANQSDTESP